MEENLASYSQSSFVQKKGDLSEEDVTVANEDVTMTQTEVNEQPFRKKLKDCTDFEYVLERTKPIYQTLLKSVSGDQ